MRVRGGSHTPSFEGPWGSTSTCSSTCTTYESPITLQPSWRPLPRSPWSLAVDPPSQCGPELPSTMNLPSTPQRIELVRGARGRRASVVADILKEGAPGYNSMNGVDAGAFHRYYEGSTLGGCSPTSPSSRGRDSRVCGGTGVFGGTLASLGLVLPTKLEALLKLLAQSLHLVLQALCSRKAKRKDRECSSAHEHKLYLEEAVLERNIPETDLRQLVDLPPGLGYEEWLASHTIDFFHHINLIYGTVCEYCTLTGCPDMTGPGLRQYLWFDEKGKKTRVAAPQYVDYVMTFTQNTVNDESIFPTKFENDFPHSFESIVKKIHRLLFHVLAHLYHAHFREVVLLSLHAHLNCVFAHFVLFNEKFRLVDHKETEILHDLVVALKIHPESHSLEGSTELPTETTTEGRDRTLTPPICIPPSAGEGHMGGEEFGEGACYPQGTQYDDRPNREGAISPFRSGSTPCEREESLTTVTATVSQVTPHSTTTPIAGAFINRVTLTEGLP